MTITDPYGFIYITTNLIDGKRYIGQKKFDDYWKGYLGSGKHLREAIKKYGRENFSRNIVAIAYSKEELDDAEISIIKFLGADKSRDYYNIAEGGCVKGRTGEDAFWYGKQLPAEMIEKQKKGRNTEKRVYQYDLDGNLMGEYVSLSAAASANGIAKQNISVSCKNEHRTCNGFFWSYDGNRKNIQYDPTKNHQPKSVTQFDYSGEILLKKFPSVRIASEQTGINRSNIHNCCVGRVRAAGGYKWRYDSP